MRSPVCLRVSLVPIYYHTLTVYSLPRETVIQDPLVIGDCYLYIIRIQTITYPSSVFLLYANRGFIHRTPTLPLPHTQLNQYQLDLVSGLAFISPLCIHASPCTLEDTITVHTVASLRPLRGLQFYFFYTLRPSNRHYFPSKSSSPSSQYSSLEKRRTFFAVFMANELSYEAAASTNTQRTPCFRCFLQDVRLTSIRE